MSCLKKCKSCEKEFETNDVRKLTCSVKCRRDIGNTKTREEKRIRNNEIYKDISNIPVCKICGWKSRSLSSHLRMHDLTVQQYKDQYGAIDEDIFHSSYTEEKRNRMKGEHNPGYQHGGTMSSFSKNFKKYENLNEDEKTHQIGEQIIKANNTKRENNSYTTTVEYYTTRGFSLAESEVLLKQRQATVSLEICINKYGEELGREKWISRQEQWLLSEGLKSIKIGVSKISQELFDAISPDVKHNHCYATNGIPGINNEYKLRTDTGMVILDFFAPSIGKIIEFDGDYWHSVNNPRRICREERDAKILKKHPTFKILHIWESEYKRDKEGTRQKCLEFLKE